MFHLNMTIVGDKTSPTFQVYILNAYSKFKFETFNSIILLYPLDYCMYLTNM